MGWSRKAWSPFHAAKQKGREAALAGLPRDTCPYLDHRTDRGTITWSRAFQRAWLEGYDQALTERQAAHPTDRSENDGE